MAATTAPSESASSGSSGISSYCPAVLITENTAGHRRSGVASQHERRRGQRDACALIQDDKTIAELMATRVWLQPRTPLSPCVVPRDAPRLSCSPPPALFTRTCRLPGEGYICLVKRAFIISAG